MAASCIPLAPQQSLWWAKTFAGLQFGEPSFTFGGQQPWGSAGKESACKVGDLSSSLGWEDPLEKGKATHFSILAWRIPWTV